jgi:dTDP-4-dehydrorhamnose reductase
VAITRSVLILGGSGYLGTHLALKLRDEFKVFATYNQNKIKIPGVTLLPFEINNRSWTKRLVYTSRPDILIYIAGNNSVEWADKNAQEAELVHSIGVAAVAHYTDIIQPRFIYISNPYVFDGFRGNYHEEDTVLPGTVLGRVKNGGENVVRSRCLNYVILRTSPLIGRGNGINLSLLDQWRMKLDRNEKFEVGFQEVHSFSHVEGFCDTVSRIINSGIKNRVVHYGGLTKMSQLELAQTFAKRFGYNPHHIIAKRFKHRKTGISEDFIFDFSLNSTYAVQTLKVKPLLLEESFDLVEKQLVPRL